MYTRDLYLYEILPTYKEMVRALDEEPLRPKATRLYAINLCNSLNNLIDFFVKEFPAYTLGVWKAKNAEELRLQLENTAHIIDNYRVQTRLYGYIRDIANCSKHLSIGRQNAIIKHANQISEQIALIKYSDADGEYFGSKGTVIVDDGSAKIPVDVLAYLSVRVVNDMLVAVNAIPSTPRSPAVLRSYHLTRAQALQLGGPHVEVPIKESFEVPMQPYIYDNIPFLQIRYKRDGEKFNTEFQMKINPTEELF